MDCTSPQFKDQDEQSTSEARKFSTFSVATPETKYRSTYTPMKLELSKVSGTTHMRQKTAKFHEENPKLYDEINQLFEGILTDKAQAYDTPITFANKQEFPTKITYIQINVSIRRTKNQFKSLHNNQELIDKIYEAKKLSHQFLFENFD